MTPPDASTRDKQRYATPRLMTHGTLKDITLMRFNWQGRREWGEDPVVNVS
jgi:hypothetical protein